MPVSCPPGLEHKVALLDAQALTKHRAEPGSFEGLASHFGNVDSYGDIVQHGAYRETLPEFLKSGSILWAHDLHSMPIATPTDARETDKGLWIECEYHATRSAQDARKIIKERAQRGKTVGLSIGYVADDFSFRDDGVRILKKISLYEVSVVLLPANRNALVTSSKAGRPDIAGHHERRAVWIDGMKVLAATAGLIGAPTPARHGKSDGELAELVIADAERLLARMERLLAVARRSR